MYDIPPETISPDFVEMWSAAGRHLARQAQGPLGWLKADLYQPLLEHLSFRLGNQLFFIHVEDSEGMVVEPSDLDRLLWVAQGMAGQACTMPMQRTSGEWRPVLTGWGLQDAQTGSAVDPVALVSDEPILMTDWEVHDFAVQVVRDSLRQDGVEVVQAHSCPSIDPALWIRRRGKLEWVIVRAVRYPMLDAKLPENWRAIAEACRRRSGIGSFASVALMRADDPVLPDPGSALPLLRGYGMFPRFQGLQPLA